jgi:hypothetical protein
MKKYFSIIGFAAAAYGIIYWLRKKASAGSNLRYEPVDVAIDLQKIKASLFTRIYYKVKLNLINDESVSVNIKSVNLNVAIGDRPFGTIVKNQSFSIPGRSSQTITLETSFSSFSAIALIKDIILEGFQDPIIVTGYISTDLGRVNVDFRKNPSGGITGVKKYDLGFAKMGNGTTVYNRNKMQFGDYENVAHISEFGNVTYYKKLPSYAVNMIMAIAASIKGMKENTLKYQGERPYSTGFIWGTENHILNNIQGNC